MLLFAVGTMLCHQQILGVPEGQAMWKQVLLGSYVSSLCRDEVIHIHSVAAEFFDSIKGYFIDFLFSSAEGC